MQPTFLRFEVNMGLQTSISGCLIGLMALKEWCFYDYFACACCEKLSQQGSHVWNK
jgi:hypothetical protein